MASKRSKIKKEGLLNIGCLHLKVEKKKEQVSLTMEYGRMWTEKTYECEVCSNCGKITRSMMSKDEILKERNRVLYRACLGRGKSWSSKLLSDKMK